MFLQHSAATAVLRQRMQYLSVFERWLLFHFYALLFDFSIFPSRKMSAILVGRKLLESFLRFVFKMTTRGGYNWILVAKRKPESSNVFH